MLYYIAASKLVDSRCFTAKTDDDALNTILDLWDAGFTVHEVVDEVGMIVPIDELSRAVESQRVESNFDKPAIRYGDATDQR